MKRFFVVFSLIAFLCATGCTGSDFQAVEPPVRQYPQASQYEEAEAYYGALVVSRSFAGNKNGNTLEFKSSSSAFSSFSEGDEGFVSYESHTVPGVLTSCPEDGIGLFIVTHDEVPSVSDKYPGRFTVVTRRDYHCLLLPRSAVTVLNDEGDALVYILNESGTLSDRQIRVGDSDGNVYEILEGFSEGEKAVIR